MQLIINHKYHKHDNVKKFIVVTELYPDVGLAVYDEYDNEVLIRGGCETSSLAISKYCLGDTLQKQFIYSVSIEHTDGKYFGEDFFLTIQAAEDYLNKYYCDNRNEQLITELTELEVMG